LHLQIDPKSVKWLMTWLSFLRFWIYIGALGTLMKLTPGLQKSNNVLSFFFGYRSLVTKKENNLTNPRRPSSWIQPKHHFAASLFLRKLCSNFYLFVLFQRSQARGPLAAYGPRESPMRPANIRKNGDFKRNIGLIHLFYQKHWVSTFLHFCDAISCFLS